MYEPPIVRPKLKKIGKKKKLLIAHQFDTKEQEESELVDELDAEDILAEMSNEQQTELLEKLFLKSDESLNSEELNNISGSAFIIFCICVKQQIVNFTLI